MNVKVKFIAVGSPGPRAKVSMKRRQKVIFPTIESCWTINEDAPVIGLLSPPSSGSHESLKQDLGASEAILTCSWGLDGRAHAGELRSWFRDSFTNVRGDVLYGTEGRCTEFARAIGAR